MPARRGQLLPSAFLSTPSARRATAATITVSSKLINFYPRPPRGGRPCAGRSGSAGESISIHALREEGDPERIAAKRKAEGISIHALREEGDQSELWASYHVLLFLSTPSARRATGQGWLSYNIRGYFYPRPPRGGRPPQLRREGQQQRNFYPRPPRGGRRTCCCVSMRDTTISIHALREEGDCSHSASGCIISIFLSTPSARRATNPTGMQSRTFRNFYPRPPRGGRPTTARGWIPLKHFYPRPPRGGRQQKQRENPLLLSHYTPLCTNCKEVLVKQTAKSHRYLCKRLVFRCEASRKTMCAACSHWRGIKRSAHYPAQTPGAAQHARP